MRAYSTVGARSIQRKQGGRLRLTLSPSQISREFSRNRDSRALADFQQNFQQKLRYKGQSPSLNPPFRDFNLVR